MAVSSRAVKSLAYLEVLGQVLTSSRQITDIKTLSLVSTYISDRFSSHAAGLV